MKVWEIEDIYAHCPQCDTLLIDHTGRYSGYHFTCPRCKFDARGDECEKSYEIQTLISDNIERKRKSNYTNQQN